MAKIRSHEAWQELFAEYEASPERARLLRPARPAVDVLLLAQPGAPRAFGEPSGARHAAYPIRRGLRAGGGHAPGPAGADPQAPIGRTGDNITLTIGKASLTLSSSVSPAWVAALLMALEV